MHESMNEMQISGNIDRDFVALMVPHHQSAVDMARVYLETGRDPELRRIATSILASHQAEVARMRSIVPGVVPDGGSPRGHK